MFIYSLNQGQALQEKSNQRSVRRWQVVRCVDISERRQRKVRLRSASALSPEIELVNHDHIQTMEMAMYGLTPTDVRRLT